MTAVFSPVAQCTECQVRWSHGSNQYECGFAYQWNNSTPPSVAELLTLATEVRDTIGLKMRQMTSSNNVWREVHCRNLNAAVANQNSIQFPTNSTGFRGGGSLAANEAMNIVKRSGLTGRSSHGANRVSDFAEGDVDGNTLQSALMTLAASLAVSMVASRVGGRFLPAIASRLLHVAIPYTVAIVLDSDVDSQKTRLNRHGST